MRSSAPAPAGWPALAPGSALEAPGRWPTVLAPGYAGARASRGACVWWSPAARGPLFSAAPSGSGERGVRRHARWSRRRRGPPARRARGATSARAVTVVTRSTARRAPRGVEDAPARDPWGRPDAAPAWRSTRPRGPPLAAAAARRAALRRPAAAWPAARSGAPCCRRRSPLLSRAEPDEDRRTCVVLRLVAGGRPRRPVFARPTLPRSADLAPRRAAWGRPSER